MWDAPLSLWPMRRTLTGFFFFLRELRSWRICSSIASLILRASASLRSLACFASGVSFGGGATSDARGSSMPMCTMAREGEREEGGALYDEVLGTGQLKYIYCLLELEFDIWFVQT